MKWCDDALTQVILHLLVFGVGEDLVRHTTFTPVLESVQELSVRDTSVGWLHTTTCQEGSQIGLLQLEVILCQYLQKHIMAHLQQNTNKQKTSHVITMSRMPLTPSCYHVICSRVLNSADKNDVSLYIHAF